MRLVLKIIFTILSIAFSAIIGFFTMLMLAIWGTSTVLSVLSILIFPGITIPLVWLWKKRKTILIIWLICVLIWGIAVGIPRAIDAYNRSITIDVSPNIDVYEYLPFDENSKIVKFDSETKFKDPLPVVDGAAAVFPLYSAFVHATYPDTVTLYDGVLEYNNTVEGYKALAEGRTDIFFGAAPSNEQSEYALSHGAAFMSKPIGKEAFVFFVHKDNPIESLTVDQIKGIYSGEITNWSQIGGKDEEIVAYQRNEGSGSQSMLKRFMGDTPIMEAPTERVNDFMSGIIEQVADYKSKTASIGFSFRYYLEGIIQNPDIKMISIDGIAPTVENIKNGSYPITTSLLAVRITSEDNPNADKLIDWILSEEGQRIVEQTGYVPVN